MKSLFISGIGYPELFILSLVILIVIKYRLNKNEVLKTKLISKFKILSKIIFLPYWILVLFYTLFFMLFINFSSYIGINSKTSSSLINNLGNLNGVWGFTNDKNDETWFLHICYNDETMNGSYILSSKYDSWGENKNQDIKVICDGQFELIEGYDKYGDKAYIGKDKYSNNRIFLITQLENKYAIDWLLKIGMIEDEMFAEQMIKINNDCDYKKPENSDMNNNDHNINQNQNQNQYKVDTAVIVESTTKNQVSINSVDNTNYTIDDATNVYEQLSSAIRNEDLESLRIYLSPILTVWFDESNFDRESIINNYKNNYLSKWTVSKDILIDITKGSRTNEFIYKKSYTVFSKKNVNDIREFEISGYFILNDNMQIVEMKDESTKRIH